MLGTIAAVADAHGYAPSSVSVQLAQLEREAGVRLLQRAGRNVELTAAGRRVAAHAAEALAADEAVKAEIAAADTGPEGRIRLSFNQTPALALLPGLLDELSRTAPELSIYVMQRETRPALDALRARVVDVVVGIEYDPLPVPRSADVDRVDVLREDVLLALHPRHPAVDGFRPVGLDQLRRAEWATAQPGTGLDAVLRNVCNRLGGFEPDIRHRSDDVLVLGALAASGRAVALLPALHATGAAELVTRRLREERLQRTVFTAVRASAVKAPDVVALRAALHATALAAARDRFDLEVL